MIAKALMRAALALLPPEEAVVDREGCGLGAGADCCIFLLLGPAGLECGRQSSLQGMILDRWPEMTAQRCPTVPYPACQLTEEERDGRDR